MQHTSERAKSGLDLRQDSSRSPLLHNRQKTAAKASGPSVQVGKQVLANLREIQQNYKFYADSYNQHLEERQELIEVMQRNEQLEADLARQKEQKVGLFNFLEELHAKLAQQTSSESPQVLLDEIQQLIAQKVSIESMNDEMRQFELDETRC